MGKVVEKKKKKGRPSLLDLQKRTLKEQQQQQQEQTHQNSKKSVSANYDSATATPLRRSTRWNSNHSLEDNDEEGDDEEEEELNGKKRREKKLKLVLKLPSSQAQQQSQDNSESRGSDSNHEESNAVSSHKKRKINSIGDGSRIANSKKEEIKPVSGANPTSNSQGGSQLDSGPSTALPDKKLLLFILDRLQKKDTYGVFSEPVDPKELPDYHEVIEHPMDFGTIRKKLDTSAYANLEQFEKDVFLICSNAMQYNAPDTIYFRQARSILELAKKNFENLRQDSDDNEAEPKVIRRGRPPTKNLKKALGRPSLERLPSEFSSDANLASGAENTDMRKAPLASEKFSFADSSGKGYGSRNDAYSWWFTENRSDRSDEGYMMKNGKKVIVLDENRRNTYKLFHPSAAERDASVLTTFDAERKQLLAVGVYLEHGYSRSLARFAAKLGPVAWRIASQKIERSLSAGVNYGPGWVGENDLPSPRHLLLPSCSLPPGEPTSSQPCPIIQNSFSVGASSAFKTRDDGPYEKSEADNLSEKHEPSVSGGQLSRAIPAYGTTSLSHITRHEKKEISEGLTSSTGTNSTASNAGPVRPRPPFEIHQNHAIHPGMNGYNGAYGFNLPAHMAKIMGSARPSGFGFQSTHVSRTATNFLHPAAANSDNDSKFSESSCIKNPSRPSLPGCETIAAARTGVNQQHSRQGLSPKQKPDSRLPPQQKSDSVPPGSPSSRRVDSAQPDLALQL